MTTTQISPSSHSTGANGGASGDNTVTQTLGVGGIPAPTPRPGVDLTSGSPSKQLKIDKSDMVFDGGGRTVAGISITANNVTVQNFVVRHADGTGILSVGSGNTIQNCDIARVKLGDKHAPNEDDINGITFFGDNTSILYNAIGKTDFLVDGDPGGSHTDGIQTWNKHPNRSSSHVVIRGNHISGPTKPDKRFLHQGVTAEGANSSQGGGGGTGRSEHWAIADNTFITFGNQVFELRDIHDVTVTRNTFAGAATKIVNVGNGSSVTYFSDNTVPGDYGAVGVPTTPGAGPASGPTGTSAGSGGSDPGHLGATGTLATILNVGTGSTQNHFNVGIGFDTGHEDHSMTEIIDGFAEAEHFTPNAAGDAVRFGMTADGKPTPGSKHPRSELREMEADKATKKAWDSRSGAHVMSGTSRIVDLPPDSQSSTKARPWICFAQIHDTKDEVHHLKGGDIVRLQVEGDFAKGFKIVARTHTPNGEPGVKEVKTQIGDSYTVGDDIRWKIECTNGTVEISINDVVKATVTGVASKTCFFKAGNYQQFSTDSSDGGYKPDARSVVELRNLVVTHSS